MKNKGWDLQAWHPCAARSFPTALRTNHKLLHVKCWELSNRPLAKPELLQVYPKWVSRNACRLVLPLTDWKWNKPQDSTLFLLFPRTLQLHIFSAQVKANSISYTEMKKKNPALPWPVNISDSIPYMPLSFSDRLSGRNLFMTDQSVQNTTSFAGLCGAFSNYSFHEACMKPNFEFTNK